MHSGIGRHPDQAFPGAGVRGYWTPRTSAPRIASVAAVGITGLLGAASVLVFSDSAGRLVLLLGAAMLAAAFLFLPYDAVTLLLGGYLFTAPIPISKALAAGAAVYAPALEITLSDVFLVGLLVVWVNREIFGNGSVQPRDERFRKVVVLFFAWAWVSAVHAQVLSHGLLAALNLTKYFFAYLVVLKFVDSLPRLRFALGALAAGLSAQLLMGVLQIMSRSRLVLPGMKTSGQERLGYVLSFGENGVTALRPSGLLQHPNFFADYLVIALPTLLVIVLLGSRRLGRTVHRVAISLLGVTALVLVLTLSRGGWIAGGIAGIAALFFLRRANLISSRVVRRTVGLAITSGALLVLAYPPALLRVISGDERSTQSRVMMMKQAFGIIRDQPIFGVGLATYTRVAKRHVPPEFARFGPGFRETLVSGVVHNGYLAIWAERGVIGLLFTIAVYGVFLRAVMRVNEWRHPFLAAVGYGLSAALVGQLVLYNFDHFYLDSRPGVLWLVFGLLAATLSVNESKLAYVRAPVRSRRLVGEWYSAPILRRA